MSLVIAVLYLGCAGPIRKEVNLGFVNGKITDLKGVPVKGAQVYVYKWLFNEMLFEEILQQEVEVFNPKRAENDSPYQGRPEFVSVETGADGEYRIGLPSGTYCLVARKQRNRDFVQGPTNPVDLSSLVSEPVHMARGKTVSVSLRLLNTFWDASRFNQYLVRTYLTGFSGRVLSSFGLPVAGVIVTAGGEASEARRKPDFISLPTDDNGEYTLYVYFGDVYHLGVMDKAMGRSYCLQESSYAQSMTISQGQIIPKVDLVIDKETPPPGP